MVKKINKDAITIKSLLETGYSQYKVAKMLNLSKQKVNYWAHHDIDAVKNRRKKFRTFYVDKIIRLAKNKTTSQMSSKRIIGINNTSLLKRKEYDAKGKKLTIHFNTVQDYCGEQRKVRKVFFF